MTFYRALCGEAEPDCIAFVGAGGKTSAIKTLAGELTEAGRRVLITTTTKMHLPDEGEPFAQSAAEAQRLLSLQPCVMAGRPARDGRKMLGLPPEELSGLLKTGAAVLAEADGARSHPIKMTASYEPVIPPEAQLCVAVAGIDALGRPLLEACHRWELALPVLGAEPDAPVTLETVAALLRHCYLEAFPDMPFTVLLNKCDDAERMQYAKKISALLGGARCVASSLTEKKYLVI